MRKLIENPNGLSVRAIAGTRVVTIALDLPRSKTKNLLGFSFERTVKGGQPQFLLATKVLEKNLKVDAEGKPVPGIIYTTEDNPIQSFLWSDEAGAVTPGTEIQYRVAARYPDGDGLKDDHKVTFTVNTELEDDGKHGVYFNRGAIASQAFARKFNNAALTEAQMNDHTLAETKFLSRGLVEGFLNFMANTRSNETLLAVVYEHNYDLVLAAFKRAQMRNIKVSIVFDDGQNQLATDARERSGLKAGTFIARNKRVAIPHNKFIVRLDETGRAQSVWTGSTNFTANGFLGQTNVGHVVHDTAVAERYNLYFKALAGAPAQAKSVTDAVALSPDPPVVVAPGSVTAVFSPRGKDTRMLSWYGARVADAANSVMFTAPFNVDEKMVSPMAVPTNANNFILLEKPPEPLVIAAKKNNRSGLTLSYGAVLGQTKMEVGKDKKGKPIFKTVHLQDFELDKWFVQEELARKGGLGVFYIHTKILMIDPLSNDPLICSGSANFSDASQQANDENMLLIRGDTRVADIYLTEFDRIFRHFVFRDVANDMAKKGLNKDAKSGKFLKDTDEWVKPFFEKDNPKSRRREMFFVPESKSWVTKAKAAGEKTKAAAKKAAKKTAKKVVKKKPAKKVVKRKTR